jgi:hypothetical protein
LESLTPRPGVREQNLPTDDIAPAASCGAIITPE